MKKQLILTIKNRFMYNQLYPMLVNKLLRQYKEEIIDSKIFIEALDWDKKLKGRIVVEMDGSEEEVKQWVKKGFKEKASLVAMKPLLSIEVL